MVAIRDFRTLSQEVLSTTRCDFKTKTGKNNAHKDAQWVWDFGFNRRYEGGRRDRVLALKSILFLTGQTQEMMSDDSDGF